jgi:hypothetical protein
MPDSMSPSSRASPRLGARTHRGPSDTSRHAAAPSSSVAPSTSCKAGDNREDRRNCCWGVSRWQKKKRGYRVCSSGYAATDTS